MASPTIILLTLFMISSNLLTNLSHAARPLQTTNLFIKKSCISTTYPDLCISSLSSYSTSINNSPTLLAHTALSLTLDNARSASAAIKSLSADARTGSLQAGAMTDCMENVGDSIEELKGSLSEMKSLRAGKNMRYKISSIQTWVSAALTDDNSCMDGFGGTSMDGGVKTAVRGQVVKLAHLTSNALALIGALASTTASSADVVAP